MSILIKPSIVESFFDKEFVSILPKEITSNPLFLEQIKEREIIINQFNKFSSYFPKPNIDIEKALKENLITEKQLTEFYNAFSSFLENPDYQRIILYLPLEILPSNLLIIQNGCCEKAIEKFKEVYLRAWRKLLTRKDARASFVDGDIIELEYRKYYDLPRIVKAAHLIPILMKKGFIDFKKVLELMEKSDDQILRDSIADTFLVLNNLGFINDTEIELMQNSSDWLLNNMAKIIKLESKAKKLETQVLSQSISLHTVQEEIRNKIKQIESKNYGDMTEKRKKWLKEVNKRKIIELYGEKIKLTLIEKELTLKTIQYFITLNPAIEILQAIIEGIRLTILTITEKKALLMYEDCEKIILNLLKNEFLADDVSKFFRHAFQLGLVDKAYLDNLKIFIPNLIKFSENLKPIENELIQKFEKLIKVNSELLEYIYPIIILFGSKVKGYGRKNSDIDIGVFVKPEVHFSERPKLKHMLNEIDDEIVEFWLEDKDGLVKVRDDLNFYTSADKIGRAYWVHIIFGAMWLGKDENIKELFFKLLSGSNYLFENNNKKIAGEDARSVYIEELEFNSLQYRLMHSGYAQFYPPCGGIDTPHCDDIDGKSMFWDSGYRWLATKIYLQQVFLPYIPDKKS